MEIDNAGGSESAAAQRIAGKKQQQEIEEQRVQLEIGRAQRERQLAVDAEHQKGEREIVEISRQAANQMDISRKQNSDRVRALDANQQTHFEALAAKTTEDLKRIDNVAAQTIEAHKFGTMEKIKAVTDRAEDPFYRMKSLDPSMTENAEAYIVQVRLPEHEAENLFISAEGPYVKLSLARRFQDNAKAPEGNRKTLTSSYQSVVEQLAIPGAYDGRKIERSYANGVVTLKIPKQKFTVDLSKS